MTLSPALIQSQINTASLFRQLPEATRNALGNIASSRPFSAREIVVEESLPSTHLYLIVTGSLQVYTHNEHLQVIELGTLKAGHYFGEVGYISNQPATATIEGVQPGLTIAFPHFELRKILQPFPHIERVLTRLTIHRAQDTMQKLSDED